MICATEAYHDWTPWSRSLKACRFECETYTTARINDFQKVSEISDDFQNLLIFALLIRNINIANNLFEKNIEIEQMFIYNKDWRAIHTKPKIESIDKSEMEKGR